MHDEESDCIFYDIDCGCFMYKKHEDAKLACVRLEDEMIFYQDPQESKNEQNLYLDSIMSLVVGDVLGVSVEFSNQEERAGSGYGNARIRNVFGDKGVIV